MKRILLLLVVSAMVFLLAACGSPGTETDVPQNTQPDPETETSAQAEKTAGTDPAQNDNTGQAKILVAYFSRTGENYNVGYIEKGNTHIVADMIAEQTGGDTFEIRTVTPYPDDHDECTEVAKQEQDEDARPELAESIRGSVAQDSQDGAARSVAKWLRQAGFIQ